MEENATVQCTFISSQINNTLPFLPQVSAPANVLLNSESNSSAFVTVPEIFAIFLLAVETFVGAVVNLIVMLLYLRQRDLLQNVGNIFTVNLMVIDLIMLGIAVPTTISTHFLQPGRQPGHSAICFVERTIIIFCGIASAAATTLLALDRGDISLRASKRFFDKRRRPFFALATMWSLVLTTTIIPTLLMKHNGQKGDHIHGVVISLRLNDTTHATLTAPTSVADQPCLAQCNLECTAEWCRVTRADLEIQLIFQIAMFGLSVLLIFFVYMKILWYVHQRCKRQTSKMHDNHRPHHATKWSPQRRTSVLLINYMCCKWVEHEKDVREGGTELMQCSRSKSEKRSNYCTSVDSNEKTLLNGKSVAASVPSDQSPLFTNMDGNATSADTTSKSKTNFAAVVSVVMTIRRMRAKNMKARKKRLRHLRKMTVLILVSFGMCWIPFHLLPVVRYFYIEKEVSANTCLFSDCVFNRTAAPFPVEFLIDPSGENDKTWNTLFLWSVVCAGASGILNPILYSFSREKIQKILQNFWRERRRHEEAKAVGGRKEAKPPTTCTLRGGNSQTGCSSSAKTAQSLLDASKDKNRKTPRAKTQRTTSTHEANREQKLLFEV